MRACLRLAPLVATATALVVVFVACGSSQEPEPPIDPTGDSGAATTTPDPSFGEGGVDGRGCVNLECKQVTCSGGTAPGASAAAAHLRLASVEVVR